jgi:hypothetical protein
VTKTEAENLTPGTKLEWKNPPKPYGLFNCHTGANPFEMYARTYGETVEFRRSAPHLGPDDGGFPVIIIWSEKRNCEEEFSSGWLDIAKT